jgi:iron complex outermembrane recepter protein
MKPLHTPHAHRRPFKAGAPLKLTALACALGGLTAGTGWAETLDGVVVSASRAEQRSFDAPAALDSVNRDLIESAGPQVNLSESLVRVPGLTILNRQNYAQDLQLSIRGFGSRAPFGIRGIRLLIDGIPATTPDGQAQGSSVALSSTERIEVLRGPLAQLYGNAAGGVIQAWTRDAPETPEAGFQLHTGSWDMLRSVWQLGGKVGSVGVIADYSTFDTDGFRDNSQTKRRQFNSKISFGPSEQTRVNLVVNHFDMPLAQDPLGLTAEQLAADPTQAGGNAKVLKVRKITRQSQLGASLTHALDAEHSVTARAYAGTRENLQYLNNNFNTVNSTWVGLDRTYQGMGLQYNAQNEVGGVPLKWVAGYEYDRSSERRQGGAARGGEKFGDITRNEDNTASNSDVFLQGTALLSERWSLIGGMRHSTVRFNSRDYYVTDTNPDGSGAVRYSATNPVLGVTWHAGETVNVYANWGKGFETPTLAEMAYQDNGVTLDQQFNPTLNASSSRHLEVGAKWTPTPQSRVDLALFDITTTDEIVVSRNLQGQSAFKNAPSTSRTGLELSARSVLGENWQASLSASTIKARFSQSFSTNQNNLPVPVNAGNKLPGIPQHFVFGELLWADAGFADTARKARLGTQAGLELIDAGKLYANDTNTASAAGYSLLNLKASHAWRVGSGTLTAYARLDNATDRSYVGSVIVNQTASQFYEPAPGRNWTLGLRLVLPL